MRVTVPLLAFALIVAAGCDSAPKPYPRDANEQAMFGPATMRLHPTFTQVKDWTGDGKPDGIEAMVELQDQFGEPTRAAGRVIFELFQYRPYTPDPRGPRSTNPWVTTITTREEQGARWNRALRAYTFELQFPQIHKGEGYVLTASFEHNGGRLFDQLILEPK
jgi:hypothetical protein